jgi:hypothetical protein
MKLRATHADSYLNEFYLRQPKKKVKQTPTEGGGGEGGNFMKIA